MNKRNTTIVLSLMIISITSIAAKKPTTLKAYISSLGFEPFNPPRTADGLAAVISFDRKGRESVESQPGSCLDPKAAGALPKNDPVAVSNIEYKVTGSNNFGASVAGDAVAQAVGISELNASAAIGTDKVAGITVKLTNPYRNRLVRDQTIAQVIEKAKNPACAAIFNSKKNLIIQSVFGAEGISYTFTDSGGKKVNLTLKLLKALGLSADSQSKFDGKGSIDITGNVLLGYNAWQASKLAGIEKSDFELVEVTPKNIARLRAAAMK